MPEERGSEGTRGENNVGLFHVTHVKDSSIFLSDKINLVRYAHTFATRATIMNAITTDNNLE